MASKSTQSFEHGRMPEPRRFSKLIKDVEGHYDIDGVSQDDNAKVIVASYFETSQKKSETSSLKMMHH